jgi:hypothetical protein
MEVLSMRRRGFGRLVRATGIALLAAGSALASDAPAEEPKNEIVVFGGASILDAARGQDTIIGLPGWVGDRWPGFPDVQVRTETSLGGSALFGARYSRYVKGRLAVEADLAVAPTHDLAAGGELCVDGSCYGGAAGSVVRGPWGRGPGRADLDLDDLRTRNVTAWHYGAGLAYDVTGGDVRPVVILGAGGVSYSGARESSTDFALRFGLGLKVFFGRIGGRVDVVDHLVTDHFLTGEAEHDIHATAGFLVRF